MLINIRGTSGSGKSTIVRNIMALYDETEKIEQEGRRQPLCYKLTRSNGRPLWVIGHYERACGGCDTISGLDTIYELIYEGAEDGCDVIYEGLIVASDVTRAITGIKKHGGMVIELNTTIEECGKGIQARRDARGDERPLSLKNTISKMQAIAKQRVRFRDAGVDFRLLGREDAFVACRAMLGV